MAQRLSRYSLEILREPPAVANPERLSRYSLEVLREGAAPPENAQRLSRYSLEILRGGTPPAPETIEQWGFIPI